MSPAYGPLRATLWDLSSQLDSDVTPTPGLHLLSARHQVAAGKIACLWKRILTVGVELELEPSAPEVSRCSVVREFVGGDQDGATVQPGLLRPFRVGDVVGQAPPAGAPVGG